MTTSLARRLCLLGLVSLGTGLFSFAPATPVPAAGSEALDLVEDLLYLPVHFPALERALLLDGADGRLDRFDLVDAGLIASGATDAVTLSEAREHLRHLQQHALLSIPYLMQTDQMALELFRYLHAHVLRRFSLEPVTVLDLWRAGRYNCITASWIYYVFAQTYDLPVSVVETPVHAYIRLDVDPPVPIELTDSAYGFDHPQNQDDVLQTLLVAGLITVDDLDCRGVDRVYRAYLDRRRTLTPVQVLSVLYYNRALAAFEADEPDTAFRCALAARALHPQDDRYRGLVRDLGLAYATALRRDGDTVSQPEILQYLADLDVPARP